MGFRGFHLVGLPLCRLTGQPRGQEYRLLRLVAFCSLENINNDSFVSTIDHLSQAYRPWRPMCTTMSSGRRPRSSLSTRRLPALTSRKIRTAQMSRSVRLKIPLTSTYLDNLKLNAPQFPTYDAGETKKIVRKIDYRVLPPLTILYLLSFIDRSNIGNARIAGMNADLNLSGSQYNMALTVWSPRSGSWSRKSNKSDSTWFFRSSSSLTVCSRCQAMSS